MADSNPGPNFEWKKCPIWPKQPKLVIYIEGFHRFQKNPELLEFLDSDCRIGFSDQN